MKRIIAIVLALATLCGACLALSSCGETTDYTVNQSWWRLLINGQEGMEGANTLLITDGSTYRWEYKIGW